MNRMRERWQWLRTRPVKHIWLYVALHIVLPVVALGAMWIVMVLGIHRGHGWFGWLRWLCTNGLGFIGGYAVGRWIARHVEDISCIHIEPMDSEDRGEW